MPNRVQVAAAAIVNEAGQVLIARRPATVDQGGLWEFPGGKLAPYETGRQALKRELREELGIDVTEARPLIRVHHDYPDRTIVLDVWKVLAFTGEPYGREGQPVRWVDMKDLNDYTFPAANQPIVKSIQLPGEYCITAPAESIEAYVEQVQQRLSQGLNFIQLRAPELNEADYQALAEAVLPVCHEAGARLILNAAPEILSKVAADGVHLTHERLMALDNRPISHDKWLSVACHDPSSLSQAKRIGADVATLSPVCPTQSHPEAKPLGWHRFQSWVEQAGIPVFALGGMSRHDARRAQALGGQGIAGINVFEAP